ncbi:hypothetical protein [Methanocella sp. MCL-LM]|uniref:hypothetical protein n=1 Tax=Methanocella sp. MCL-LM TaxID=3412035 RepID=UPI003C711FC7
MKTCANCKHVRPSSGMCKKNHAMDARGLRKDCRDWLKQDCTNCRYLTKDATTYYYETTHKLWWIGRGNPYTGDRCEGCSLRAYASIRQTIDQVKRDTSDLYETVGSLSVECVTGRYDLVSTLELIAESISTSTSKAGELALRAREIERTSESVQLNPTRPAEAVKGILVAARASQASTSESVE